MDNKWIDLINGIDDKLIENSYELHCKTHSNRSLLLNIGVFAVIAAAFIIAVVLKINHINRNIDDNNGDVGAVLESTTETQEEETPHSDEDMISDDEEQAIVEWQGGGSSIIGGAICADYKGDRVEIPYRYYLSSYGELEIGLMVFCDGVQVPFSINDGSEGMMQCFKSKGNNVEIDGGWNVVEVATDMVLSFVPCGKKGDTVSVEVVSVVEPMVDVELITYENNDDYMFGGKRGYTHSVHAGTVELIIDGLDIDEKTSEKSEVIALTKEEIDRATTVDEYGNVNYEYEFFKVTEMEMSGLNPSYRYAKQGEIIDFSITYCGTDGSSVYTSVYIDNKVIAAFDDCETSKCHVDKRHRTTVSGQISTAGLEPGKHLCYATCVGAEKNCFTQPFIAFIIDVGTDDKEESGYANIFEKMMPK